MRARGAAPSVAAPPGRSPPPLEIPIAASKHLACLLSAVHGSALVLAAAMHPYATWAWALCMLIAIDWAWTVRRFALLRHARAFVALELRAEADCALRTRDGEWLRGRVLAGSYALPWLVVLHVAIPGHRLARCVALFPDAVGAAMHRRLRVRLIWANYRQRRERATGASI